MILHDQKFIYLGIPKTGCTSIMNVFGVGTGNRVGIGWNPHLKRYLQHITIQEYVEYGLLTEEQVRKYFKAAIVRNPWDRVVSEYVWRVAEVKRRNYYDNIEEYYIENGFDQFIYNIPKMIALKGVDDLSHMRSQSDYTHVNGKQFIDYIGRFETLQHSFQEMCKLAKINSIRFNEIKLPIINKTQHKHYSTYFNYRTRDFIRDLYEQDVKNFGYTF